MLRSLDLIDIYDGDGIQKLELDAPKIYFEAGWTPAGAVFVRHVRVKENTSLAALEAAFPQLKGRRGAVYTEALARSLGAERCGCALVSGGWMFYGSIVHRCMGYAPILGVEPPSVPLPRLIGVHSMHRWIFSVPGRSDA